MIHSVRHLEPVGFTELRPARHHAKQLGARTRGQRIGMHDKRGVIHLRNIADNRIADLQTRTCRQQAVHQTQGRGFADVVRSRLEREAPHCNETSFDPIGEQGTDRPHQSIQLAAVGAIDRPQQWGVFTDARGDIAQRPYVLG